MKATLPFPADKPDAYIRLRDEPVFDPARHLALEPPAAFVSLADLGYDAQTIAACPSELGLTAPFRVLSAEGLAAFQALAARMKSNRNEDTATGEHRLGAYIRGAGYRSQFVRDFCECPQLLAFLSELAGATLARHSVPAVACGINYAPEDITRAVDTWHVDSVSFDAVILLTDPRAFRGGEFQYFLGTKAEGEAILGASVGGTQNELPPARVKSVAFPGAGYGFLQQGNLVFHRARALREKAERVTMIPSFVVLGEAGADQTNVDAMRHWRDPGMLAELARHEAWLARARLGEVIDELPLTATPAQIAAAVETAVAGLNRYAANLRSGEE